MVSDRGKRKNKKVWHIPRQTKFDGKPSEKFWNSDDCADGEANRRIYFDKNKNIVDKAQNGPTDRVVSEDISSSDNIAPPMGKMEHTANIAATEVDVRTTIKNTSQTKPDCAKCESQNRCDAKQSASLKTLEAKESKEKLESYKIPPTHDVFRQLVIPRYSTIQNGCVITKQMVRRKLLRERFIALAHHYVGVPYAQKYWQEGTKEHASPFFLDCCGLVRRILQDMAYDLGFVIGPWNQSYLYDTLPEDIPFDKLKPGDLIFYRAHFYNPKKSKAQKHNMVHVEVYLGNKDYPFATIGSRQIEAKVAYHSDYRFDSKYYKVYQHHFKSIDTWLDGNLKSFCKSCSWNWNRKPLPRETKSRVKLNDRLTTFEKRKKQRPKSAAALRHRVKDANSWQSAKPDSKFLQKLDRSKSKVVKDLPPAKESTIPPIVPRSRNPTNVKLKQSSASNQLWNNFNLSNQVYLRDIKSKKEKHKLINHEQGLYPQNNRSRQRHLFSKSSKSVDPDSNEKAKSHSQKDFSDFIKRKTQKRKVNSLPSNKKYGHVRPLGGRKRTSPRKRLSKKLLSMHKGKPLIDKYRYTKPGIL